MINPKDQVFLILIHKSKKPAMVGKTDLFFLFSNGKFSGPNSQLELRGVSISCCCFFSVCKFASKFEKELQTSPFPPIPS